MKVLVAVDGSAGSFEAVAQLGRVLAAERDEIVLYCSPPDVRVRATHPEPQVLARAQEGLAEAIFEEARKRLPDALQPRVRTIMGMQDPRHGIVIEAEAWPADLVALGARGLTPLERLLLGSVSRAVVHKTGIPAWVARPNPTLAQHPMNVLLACETPDLGRASADVLTKFTWPHGTRFFALSVVRSIFAGRVPEWLEQQARSPDVEAMVQAWVREHEEDLRASKSKLEEFTRGLPAPLSSCEALVAEGEPAREILATVQKQKIDLVVVGSQHKRSMATIIMGSTSEAVLNHAACSVLVVPHPGSR
jgi:nucleotide-binding universal stress UspA family protein